MHPITLMPNCETVLFIEQKLPDRGPVFYIGREAINGGTNASLSRAGIVALKNAESVLRTDYDARGLPEFKAAADALHDVIAEAEAE